MFENRQQGLMFSDIAFLLQKIFPNFKTTSEEQIPACETLNHGFTHKNLNDKNLRFFIQDETLPFAEMGYEERIFLHGLIATRKQNWHDFFNAMVWHKYPETKKAINAIHYQEIHKQKSSLRSRKRDLLTLFDESGVIVVAGDKYLDMIRNHQWVELFIENKESWLDGTIQLYTFGHAMFEKYLNPYIGMTAQALLLSNFKSEIDVSLARDLENGKILNSKAELSPLPLLGIPYWHKNQDKDFYANKSYFR